MHIRRLDICGFKSFNERVVIAFEEGITGIVGPNGCGKSNLVDALRWVMGEQSARQLRGSGMADVLFNGSERVGPAGMAEVSLTLINDRSSALPAPYRDLAEISIKRRLYRSGESEYLINNERCRLMDITELLLGTGAGKRAYSIIEQGKVGLIVNARPEERRALLEEAAGISKYRWRKQAAERKLAAAEQNLLRVSDIVVELRRQLGSLERQARKATRYRKLKDSLRQLELRAAAVNWLELAARQGHLRRVAEEGGRLVEEFHRLLQTHHAERLACRQLLDEAVAGLAAVVRKEHELEKDLQRAEQLKGFCAKEKEELKQRESTLNDSLVSLRQREQRLLEEQAGLADLLASTESAVAAAELARAEAEVHLGASVGSEEAMRAELEAQRHSTIEATGQLSVVARELAEVTRRIEETQATQTKLVAESHHLTERQTQLQQKLTEVTGFTAETRQLKLRLETEQGELELLLGRVRSKLASEVEEHTTLGQTLAASRSRLHSLVELRRRYEGYQEGVRTLLHASAEGVGPGGMRSVVADVLQAPVEIEAALEAYLGERLQELIVEDEAAGLEALSFLRERAGGRGTFIPLDVAKGIGASSPSGQPGVIGRAVELIRVAQGAERVVEAVLGRAWIVSDLETAVALRNAGADADLVTLSGEVLFQNGMLSGGRSAEAASGALHQRREIEELASEVEQVEARFVSAGRSVAGLRAQIAAGEESLRALSQGSREKEVSLAHQQQDVRRMTEQVHECEERLARLAVGLVEGDGAISDLLRAKQEIESEQLRVVDVRGATMKAAEAIEQSLAGRSEEVQRARSRLTEIQMALAADRERRLAAVARSEKLAEAKRAIETEARTTEEQLTAAHSRAVALSSEERDLMVTFDRLQQEVGVAGSDRANLVEVRERRAVELAALEAQEDAERTRVDLERQNHGTTVVALRECEMEIAHLETLTRDLHGLELASELWRLHLEPLPGEDQAEKLRELRALVAGMGEINLAAIDEHREIEDRHAKLSGQQLDLQQGIAQLREAIARIGRQSQRRFRETFELISLRFSEVFPRMFGGGRASLELLSAEGDLPEGGVEILAQPPGKKLQGIDLMSGGEKALTAVALVFSIFLSKPTPFCLLDEVDAPLDEANVGRYLQALREMSSLSQFIVITHNKRTMEAADTLYGVTMEEPGCSKLVSVKLSRPEASAA